MKLLFNILKAFCIALGAFLLLIVGTGAMLLLRYGASIFSNTCINVNPIGILVIFLFFFFLAFGVLYLPPKGQMYAAIGALSLLLSALIWIGIQTFNAPG